MLAHDKPCTRQRCLHRLACLSMLRCLHHRSVPTRRAGTSTAATCATCCRQRACGRWSLWPTGSCHLSSTRRCSASSSWRPTARTPSAGIAPAPSLAAPALACRPDPCIAAGSGCSIMALTALRFVLAHQVQRVPSDGVRLVRQGFADCLPPAADSTLGPGRCCPLWASSSCPRAWRTYCRTQRRCSSTALRSTSCLRRLCWRRQPLLDKRALQSSSTQVGRTEGQGQTEANWNVLPATQGSIVDSGQGRQPLTPAGFLATQVEARQRGWPYDMPQREQGHVTLGGVPAVPCQPVFGLAECVSASLLHPTLAAPCRTTRRRSALMDLHLGRAQGGV